MWNGNEDEEGLKEGLKNYEVLECIRVNGGEFVRIQTACKIGWEGVDVK